MFSIPGNKAVASVSLPANAGSLVASPDGSRIYASLTGGNGIAVISTADNSVVSTIAPGGTGSNPDLALTADGKTLLALDGVNKSLNFIDTAASAPGGALSLATEAELFGVWTTPDSTQAYIATGSGYNAQGVRTFDIEVMDLATRTVLRRVPSCPFVRAIAFSPDGRKAYVGCETGEVSVLDTVGGTVAKSLRPGFKVQYAQLGGSGTKVLVAGAVDDRVAEIDIATDTVTGTVSTASQILGLAVPRAGTNAYVVRREGQTLTMLSPMTVTNARPAVFTDRIFGADRYETAVAVSREYFVGAGTVYVATGEQFADALAAAPAANKEYAPLLLTRSRSLPPVVQDEIIRLKPGKVVVVGGEGAVSAAVFQDLKKLVPNTIRRSGADRYATARAVVAGAFPSAQSIALVTGADYPDALSAAALGPVLLVPPGTTRLDVSTMTLLGQLKAASVYIVGGSGVVSTSIEKPLRDKFIQVYRFGGTNRFETNQLVNAASFAPASDRTYYVSGWNFPDALTISAVMPSHQGQAYMVQPNCLPAGVLKAVSGTTAATRVTLLGGSAVVGDAVAFGQGC
ncbi:cell wall-binding repeat-containing protein [Arthrobacter sp. STN4]|uniref:cell wall-binding repeat-containing protein n=1 Tax=Arthrobacter sp. STN4 TaxID=2923276 RepID=UPI002119E48B|nr:cell wall-binding repeat-containing protein [Arthrobacter sp. STN4]MCQ9163218.1 cell wall-binding repeat-containing protein [Arthrobacter sp. STN4]